MKKVVIWYDGIVNIINKKSHGGAEVQLLYFAKELAKDKNYEVIILNKEEDFTKFNIKFISEKKIKKTIKSKNNKIIKYIQIFKKIKPDIVITRTASKKVGYAAIASKIIHFKTIFMCAHKNDTNKIFEKEQKLFPLYNIGIWLSSKIITQNKEQKELLQKYYNKKSEIILSGQEINLNKNNEKREHILWIGRSIEWKRPEIIIKLAKIFPKEKFKIICNIAKNKKKYQKKLKEQSKKLKNITFTDYIPNDKINEQYQKAKIFINTSTSEGFPNTFIEAGKNKTPIISFNINPNNIFNNNKIGFYCHNNLEKLEINTKKLLNNKIWQEYSKNIFKYVQKNHNIKITIKKYKEIIDKLK